MIIGSCGDSQTNQAALSGGGLQILDQPLSETLCQGVPASFLVSTTDGSATAQWEMYEPYGQTWVAIAQGVNHHSVLGEFVATVLLYTPSNLPIAIRINMEWRGSGVGSAFAYAVFLMVIVSAVFAVSRRFASRTI